MTLPSDSINDNIRADLIERFEDLKKSGAKLHFCKWNVGNPERTTTAVGRWYLFYGKFIAENCDIARSANFTEGIEFDAAIVHRDDPEKVREFNQNLTS